MGGGRMSKQEWQERIGKKYYQRGMSRSESFANIGHSKNGSLRHMTRFARAQWGSLAGGKENERSSPRKRACSSKEECREVLREKAGKGFV